VDTISPEQFASLYADFGFDQALDRDPDSLSYLVEPAEGLWVIAIDSCKYADNMTEGSPDVSGAIKESTRSWVEAKLAQAKQKGKAVLAFMHHGLVEHFSRESTLPELGTDYVIDSWSSVSRALAEAGLRLVFTGHFHAQDITKQTWDGTDAFVFDVETGSLDTYPNPYRKVSIDADGMVTIKSDFVDSIDYDTGGADFRDYSRDFMARGIGVLTQTYLGEFGVSTETINRIKPTVVDAFLGHYQGDENPTEDNRQAVQSLISGSDAIAAFLGGYLENLQTDLPPSDNDAAFNLKTGAY
jgi:hypothetical protein